MIQNFIPGTVFIASLLGAVSPENISYPNYLAYNLDPVLLLKAMVWDGAFLVTYTYYLLGSFPYSV